MKKELILDNLGVCRFHRGWAEEMLPPIIEELFGVKDKFLENIDITASRISSRNASVFLESERSVDIIHTFLRRIHDIEKNDNKELLKWINYFDEDKNKAALDFWYEINKRANECLREF